MRRLNWNSKALILAVVGSVCSDALAQSRPSIVDDDASRPVVSSPYWNQGPVGFPTPQVDAVAPATAAATDAKWRFHYAQKERNIAARSMLRNFEDSPEYVFANNELKAAWSSYESARQAAVRPLKRSDVYLAGLELRDRVHAMISDEAASKLPDAGRLAALASLKLQYATPARAAEVDIIANSPEVRASRQRLVDAGKRLSELRRLFNREARDSIELAELRRSVDEARITQLAARSYEQATRRAADVAINYAYRSRRIDKSVPVVVSGYGNGYGVYNNSQRYRQSSLFFPTYSAIR